MSNLPNKKECKECLRVEILLPIRFRNPHHSEKKKFIDAYEEIVEKFRGVTYEDTPIMGSWVSCEETVIVEPMMKYWVICEENEENLQFLTNLKDKLKGIFVQTEILMFYTKIHRM